MQMRNSVRIFCNNDRAKNITMAFLNDHGKSIVSQNTPVTQMFNSIKDTLLPRLIFLLLRIHWRLLTILKTSEKVYEVMFFDM